MSVRTELDQAWQDWAQSTLLAKWRKANPGEAAKLDAYRAGGARPVLTTPVGRALVAETAAWLLSAPAPPPPPPDDAVIPTGTTHAAVVAAITLAKTEGRPLRFEAKTYTYTGRLDFVGLDVSGDPGATLVASNPDDANCIVRSGTTLRDLTITCPTASSRSQATAPALVNVVSGSTGWLVEGCTLVRSRQVGLWCATARNGIIRGNTIRDTFADAMHITHGSSDILIDGNTVENVGDDMIGLVSYEGAAGNPPRNARITVRNNRLLGQTWGRGVGVVGGEDIVIEDNLIQHSAAAGVYVACESQYTTFPVDRVTVNRNRFVDVDWKNIHNANVLCYVSRTGGHVRDVTGAGNTFDAGKTPVRITGISGAVSGVSVT